MCGSEGFSRAHDLAVNQMLSLGLSHKHFAPQLHRHIEKWLWVSASLGVGCVYTGENEIFIAVNNLFEKY